MEHPLFIKLEQDPPTLAEQAAHSALAQIINNAAQQVRDKFIKEKEVEILTRIFMDTEINTVAQAFTHNPPPQTLQEDPSAVHINTFSATTPANQKDPCLLKLTTVLKK